MACQFVRVADGPTSEEQRVDDGLSADAEIRESLMNGLENCSSHGDGAHQDQQHSDPAAQPPQEPAQKVI